MKKNKFLQNETSLIKYAAFHGSVQIFKYLTFNNIEIDSSLFTFGFCGRNPDIIHLLEANEQFQYKDFIDQLKVAIKCHHDEIAEYILNNYIKENDDIFKIGENNDKDNIYHIAFRYNNYKYFPSFFDNKLIFDDMCEFGYFKIVDYLLNNNIEIDENHILTKDITLAAKKNKIETVNLLMKKGK